MKVTEMLEMVCGEMCDKYCKFPEQYSEDEEDRLYEEHCNECPMVNNI